MSCIVDNLANSLDNKYPQPCQTQSWLLQIAASALFGRRVNNNRLGKQGSRHAVIILAIVIYNQSINEVGCNCLIRLNPCTAQLSWVSGSWIFCQTKPGQACLPKLGLTKDSRTTDFRLGLFSGGSRGVQEVHPLPLALYIQLGLG